MEFYFILSVGTLYMIVFHLRNEFHFSDVHGAMNRSESRAK